MTAKGPRKARSPKKGSEEKPDEIPMAEVEKLMLDFSSNYAVSRALVEQYGIHERTARRWIARVREAWREDIMTLDFEADRAFYRAALLDIRIRAKDAGELAIELAALKRYADFAALDKPQVAKVEHVVSETEDPSKWEPGTAAALLERLGFRKRGEEEEGDG